MNDPPVVRNELLVVDAWRGGGSVSAPLALLPHAIWHISSFRSAYGVSYRVFTAELASHLENPPAQPLSTFFLFEDCE